MGDPVISVGPSSTKIPKSTSFTPLVTINPDDGRTSFEGQMATSLPSTIAQRPTLCEVQMVRLWPASKGNPPGGTDGWTLVGSVWENPTAQDDRQFTFVIDPTTGKLKINGRQNWLYTPNAMRTFSDEPLRVEARHPGPVTITLEWVVKAVLIRPEASR